MNRKTLTNDAGKYLANVRAEDGFQSPGGWAVLRDTVVIPIGFILAFVVLVLFISRAGVSETKTARAAGWTKHPLALSLREIGASR